MLHSKLLRLITVIACFTAAFSICLHAAESISSRPVGVTTINIPANAQQLASLPYIPFVPTMDSLIGGQLPEDSEILMWNNIAQRYEQVTRVNGKWVQMSTTSEVSIVAGDAFWLVNKQYTNQTLLLGGEVNLAASNSATLLPGMNLVGLPQSMAVPVAQSGLAELGKDQLVDAQGLAVSNMVPGEGYWYIRNEAGSRAWVEVLPCASEIFPAEGALPAITDIKVLTADNRQQTTDGRQQTSDLRPPTSDIRLSISLDNSCRKIDIYYKDQAAADALVLDKGWLIAETDLQVTGKSELEWTDTSSSLQSVVCGLQSSSRYYLVGNADVDANKNGIPDCRERFMMGKALASGFRPSASGDATSSLRPLASSSAPVSSSVSGLGGGASLGRIIYVDRNNGGDHLTGKAAVVVGADGPKKTVKAGLQEAGNDGSTMIIKSGVYGESLNVAGKNLKIVIQGNVRL